MSSEENMIYVSSRGILKSCDIHSNIFVSSTYSVSGYDIEWNNIKDGSTIYICSSAIPYFISNIFPNVKNYFILVSGDCDESIPLHIFKDNNFIKFIEDNRIIHWFTQNWIGDAHPKVSNIPIGLDYHTMSTGNTSWGNMLTPEQQEKLLTELNKKALIFFDRKIKCYSNFHFFTTTRYGHDRIDAINKIPKELVFYEEVKVDRLTTWKNQINYAFVISPHGNGLDCHRTWEALCLGCIPIVKTSPLNILFEDLPVLIINDWSDVTEELLYKTIHDFKNKTFKYEKLTLKYWIDKINLCRTS